MPSKGNSLCRSSFIVSRIRLLDRFKEKASGTAEPFAVIVVLISYSILATSDWSIKQSNLDDLRRRDLGDFIQSVNTIILVVGHLAIHIVEQHVLLLPIQLNGVINGNQQDLTSVPSNGDQLVHDGHNDLKVLSELVEPGGTIVREGRLNC